mmetsp:Transcript_13982/g.24935  ORF Transcript_13982/g.24935 Transcript_13982/m.24935 type:complete len:165 (+) Transcript_13982:1077-1571(+)
MRVHQPPIDTGTLPLALATWDPATSIDICRLGTGGLPAAAIPRTADVRGTHHGVGVCTQPGWEMGLWTVDGPSRLQHRPNGVAPNGPLQRIVGCWQQSLVGYQRQQSPSGRQKPATVGHSHSPSGTGVGGRQTERPRDVRLQSWPDAPAPSGAAPTAGPPRGLH